MFRDNRRSDGVDAEDFGHCPRVEVPHAFFGLQLITPMEHSGRYDNEVDGS